jgi:hypothetical protein
MSNGAGSAFAGAAFAPKTLVVAMVTFSPAEAFPDAVDTVDPLPPYEFGATKSISVGIPGKPSPTRIGLMTLITDSSPRGFPFVVAPRLISGNMIDCIA